jgi:hypothetical protein
VQQQRDLNEACYDNPQLLHPLDESQQPHQSQHPERPDRGAGAVSQEGEVGNHDGEVKGIHRPVFLERDEIEKRSGVFGSM